MSDELKNTNNTIPMANNDTRPMADNSTRPMNADESNRLLLKKDVVFPGKNDSYEIYANSRIGSGGESQVYLAKRVSDGKQVVAKIYDEYADTPLSRRNRKRIVEFLTGNNDYKKTHIMPLLDSGNILMESDDGDDFSKPIDIIPYCKDGELKRCDYRTLKNKIIPEILTALNLLHTSNLVHRDIKPSNIYMLDGEVVIADFGTSGEISIDDKFDYIGTQKKRGTVGYTAPEVWQGYAVIASDYYSFGCTIATLYKGEHVYQRLIDDSKKDDTPIKKAINTKGLPLECPDNEKDLQMLVDSLVKAGETMRAGYDDIKLWLKDSASFAASWKGKLQQGYETPSLGFDFMDKKYDTEEELTIAMLEKWEDAKRYLYKGIVANFFGPRNPSLADKAINIVESRETARNEDLGLAMFLHYLNKSSCPIYWCGKTFNSLSDISTAISNGQADESKITAMLKDQFLTWKFNNSQEKPGEDTLNRVKDAEEITSKYPQLGCYTFMYMFDSKRKENARAPDKIFKELTENSREWHQKAKEFLDNVKDFAYLISIGCKADVLKFQEQRTGNFIDEEGISDLTLLYLLFESVCEDKAYVREHYLHYGSQLNSYQFQQQVDSWFRQRLSSYENKSTEAKEVVTQIKNVNLDTNRSIDEISRGLNSVRLNIKRLEDLRNESYRIAQQKIRDEQERKERARRAEEARRARIREQREEARKNTTKVIWVLLYFAIAAGLIFATIYFRDAMSFDLWDEDVQKVLSVILIIVGAIVGIVFVISSYGGCFSYILGIGLGCLGGHLIGYYLIPLLAQVLWAILAVGVLVGAILLFKGAIWELIDYDLEDRTALAVIVVLISVSIGGYVAYNSQEYNIVIPADVTIIGESEYARKRLGSVAIHDGVTAIGNNAFKRNKLTGVWIPDSVTTIGSEAFSHNRLTSVSIGNGVTTIGNAAFANNRLTNVTIGNGVTTIEDAAFANNPVTNIVIGANVEFGNYALSSDFLTVYTNNGKVAGKYIRNDTKRYGWSIWYNNFEYQNNNGNITITDFSGSYNSEVTIPSTINGSQVTSIGDGAFKAQKITKVIIPNSVTSIGLNAFASNPITSIRLGANVKLGDVGRAGILGEGTGFNTAYANNGSRAGTYTRPNANSSTWTRR